VFWLVRLVISSRSLDRCSELSGICLRIRWIVPLRRTNLTMFLESAGACQAIARAGEGDKALRPNLFLAPDALAVSAGCDSGESRIHLRDEFLGMRVLRGRCYVDGRR